MVQLRYPFYCLFILLLTACAGQQNNVAQTTTVEEPKVSMEKKSIAQALRERIDLDAKGQAELYRQLREEDPNGYNWENEDEMTMLGYGYLWDEKPQEALVVFQLIVEQFPESANPYDSVGEAYLAVGDTAQALQNYTKTVAMNPDNYFARDQIARMTDKNFRTPSPAEMFDSKISAQEAKEDIDYLAKKLAEVNPSAFKFISQEAFEANVNSIKNTISDSISIPELRWNACAIIASINCSHTGSGRFGIESQMLPDSLRFPMQVQWIDDRMFVSDPLVNGDKIAAGTEIISINAVAVGDLVGKIYDHIHAQGSVTSSKRLEFNHWATTLLPYQLGFPAAYSIRTADNKTHALNANSEMDNFVRNTTIVHCEEPLCLDFPKEKTAHLTVASFNFYPWNNLDRFEKFMDESFSEIEAQGSEHLIIDLRGNGGGSPESSIYLLRYLLKEPFPYFRETEYNAGWGMQTPFAKTFDGDIVFLIDGEGMSTTGHFIAIAKDRQLGTIVGEELGSNHFCTAGQGTFRMENAKAEFYVANTPSAVDVNSIPDHQGVLPDNVVVQSINDYLKGVDTVLNYALQLCE